MLVDVLSAGGCLTCMLYVTAIQQNLVQISGQSGQDCICAAPHPYQSCSNVGLSSDLLVSGSTRASSCSSTVRHRPATASSLTGCLGQAVASSTAELCSAASVASAGYSALHIVSIPTAVCC